MKVILTTSGVGSRLGNLTKFNNKALNDDQLSELMNNNPMAMHEAVNEEMLELADRYI